MSASQYRLYSLLQHATHRLKKSADQTLVEAAGLTTAQAAVLVSISVAKRATQKEVADMLHLNETAMTGMVARLQNSGLVEKKRSKDDGRAWQLALTTKGRKALENTREPFSQINKKLDEALGKSATQKFAHQLMAIADAFERS